MKLVVKKGIDLPIFGKPEGEIKPLSPPTHVALNLDPFDTIRFQVLVKVGERVKIGQPLVQSKEVEGQMFVSPAAGTITEIRRGLKRRLLDIVVKPDQEEEYEKHQVPSLSKGSREEIFSLFMRSGIYPHLHLRPFNRIPSPKQIPRDIFVSAAQSLPFLPSDEKQVVGHEVDFQAGLETLSLLTDGKVHLVYREGSQCKAFTEATHVERHSVEGPHPSGNASFHIHKIAPIRHVKDYVWSLDVLGVITIGKMIREGRYFTDRIVSVAGEGIVEGRRGFVSTRMGVSLETLFADKLLGHPTRLISGDPLTGASVEPSDFLGFYDTCFSAIPENTKREPFHFFRLGSQKFSATPAYLSGHLAPPPEGYHFTTNQHGEERAFIDSRVYDRVMPMRIPTMQLIKAVLAEDYELAEQLGLLEVVPEDFALTTFICPSKIEMMDIVKQGLYRYSLDVC